MADPLGLFDNNDPLGLFEEEPSFLDKVMSKINPPEPKQEPMSEAMKGLEAIQPSVPPTKENYGVTDYIKALNRNAYDLTVGPLVSGMGGIAGAAGELLGMGKGEDISQKATKALENFDPFGLGISAPEQTPLSNKYSEKIMDVLDPLVGGLLHNPSMTGALHQAPILRPPKVEEGMVKVEPKLEIPKDDPLRLFKEEPVQKELFPEDTSNNPYLRQQTVVDENGIPINKDLTEEAKVTEQQGQTNLPLEQPKLQEQQVEIPKTNRGEEIHFDGPAPLASESYNPIEASNRLEVKTKSGDVLGALDEIKNTLPDRIEGQVADLLRKNLGSDVSLKVGDNLRHVDGLTGEERTVRGTYDPTTNTVYLDSKVAGDKRILLHELTHAAVAQIQLKLEAGITQNLTPKQIEAGDRIQFIYDELTSRVKEGTMASMDPSGRKWYGLENSKEFVAEAFSNPAFQEFLKNIQLKRERTSLWNKFVYAVKDMLGLKGFSQNALAETLSAGADLIESSTPESRSLFKGEKLRKQIQMDIRENGEQIEAVKNIPGLKGLIVDLKPFEEMKPEFLKEPDISDNVFRDNLASGGRMIGAMTKNTLVNWVVEKTYQAIRSAEVKSNEALSKVGTGLVPRLRSLDNNMLSDLWAKMQAVEGKKQTVEMTPRQKMAYDAFDNIRNDIYNRINEVLQTKGMNPIQKRPNYLAGSFVGDFRSIVKNADGDVIGFVGGKTSREVNKALNTLKQQVPDAIFGNVEHNPLYKRAKFQKDIGAEFSGFQEMIDMLSNNDLLAKKLADSQDNFYSKQAFDYLDFKQRFKQKKGILGSEGNKVWKDAYTNAKEGWDAQVKWVEFANRWIEQQKVGSELQKVFSDPELNSSQKNAINYSQQYYQNAFGRRENLGRIVDNVIDTVAKTTGVGGSTIANYIRELRRFTLSNTLGFSGAFMASQLAQVWQALPTSFQFLKGRGLISDGLSSSLLGMTDALHMFIYANTGKKGFLDNISKPGKELAKYALENHIIDPHILEGTELKPRGILGKAYQQYMNVAGKTISMPDQLTRGQFFMAIGHYAMDAGLPFKEAAQLADRMTSLAMADYTRQERALVYQKMGMIGEFAGTVKTFVHNQYSQVALYGKESNKSALLTALAVQGAMGGLMGFYGMDELDNLFKWFKHTMGSEVPSPKELILQKTPDVVAYGPVSYLTGIDFSSKFSAANVLPNSVGEAVFPLISQWMNFATGVGHAVKYPTARNALKPIWEIAPTSGKAAIEQFGFTTDEGMTLSPRTDLGKFARSPSDIVKRYLGSRSLAERRDADQAYAVGTNIQARQEKLKNMETAIGQYLDAGDNAAANDLASKYVELGGDLKTLNKRLISRAGAQTRSAFEQRTKAPKSLKDIMNQQEVQKYGE